ncbi:MAG: hypothetical protein V4709_05320 [Pseudomonadota bacterium]
MANIKKTPSRLQEILHRQLPARFGDDYLPAIRATPAEAPSVSRCTVLRSPKWRREIHVLSHPELKAVLLALYHPQLFDLHEQKILFPYPQPNPLKGFHRTQDRDLQDFKGTVDVCRRLGLERRHPTIFVQDEASSGYVPFPYTGDLLLFLKPQDPVLINWSIKLMQRDFQRKQRGLFTVAAPANQLLDELDERHRIEELYYSDGGVKTHRVAGSDIDDQVFHNLKDLFDSLLSDVPLDGRDRLQARALLQEAVELKAPGYQALDRVQKRFGLTTFQTSALFRQEVWYRHVRVDLFQPIDRSRPLRPEAQDVLQVYARWFQGSLV